MYFRKYSGLSKLGRVENPKKVHNQHFQRFQWISLFTLLKTSIEPTCIVVPFTKKTCIVVSKTSILCLYPIKEKNNYKAWFI